MPEPRGAHCADVIEWPAIASVCPSQAADLEALLHTHGLDLERMAIALDGEPEFAEGQLGEAEEAVRAAWQRLQTAFEENTSVGGSCLRLRCRYHSPNSGGRYDELVYCIFYLEGCYELSPAGKKFQGLFQRRSWVRNR